MGGIAEYGTLAGTESSTALPPGAEMSFVCVTDADDLIVEGSLADDPGHDVYDAGRDAVSVRELADVI